MGLNHFVVEVLVFLESICANLFTRIIIGLQIIVDFNFSIHSLFTAPSCVAWTNVLAASGVVHLLK